MDRESGDSQRTTKLMSAIDIEMDPKQLLETLRELQELEFEKKKTKKFPAEKSQRIAELRAQVPEVVLGHHDRLLAKNKKSVVVVHNTVCGGCFLALPTGEKERIALCKDIHICQSCGRYLYVAD